MEAACVDTEKVDRHLQQVRGKVAWTKADTVDVQKSVLGVYPKAEPAGHTQGLHVEGRGKDDTRDG